VALFLTALVVCPLASINAWPFSSWRLFSVVRTARQTSWQGEAVDSSGREREYAVAATSPGYRELGHVVGRFSKRSAARRDAVCGALLQGATKRFGPSTDLVRIYRLIWLLSDRVGDRSRPPHRTLAWICDPEGAHAAT